MDVHSLSNAILLCLGITVLLFGGFACLASLPSGAVIPRGSSIGTQASEIVLIGTDYNNTYTQYAPSLSNITVAPRIILEYGDFVNTTDISSSVPPFSISARIAIEYADYASPYQLAVGSPQITVGPSPRIMIEYADYASPVTWLLQGHPKTLFIGTPTPPPPREAQENQSVIVSVNVTDIVSVNVFLNYTTNNGASWNSTQMALITQYPNSTTCLYQATISGQLAGTWVNYSVSAYDNAGNYADASASYPVVPEFPQITVLALFMIVTLVAVTAYRRKRFNLTDDE